MDLFNHLHRLGIRWHYGRQFGEVLRVMDRGTNSITEILDALFFSLIPIVIDVIIAIVALSYDLNIYFGLIIFISMFIYVSVTIIGTEYRTKFKRAENEVWVFLYPKYQSKQRYFWITDLFFAILYESGLHVIVPKHNLYLSKYFWNNFLAFNSNSSAQWTTLNLPIASNCLVYIGLA